MFFYNLMKDKNVFTKDELKKIRGWEKIALSKKEDFKSNMENICKMITKQEHHFSVVFSNHKKYNLPPLNDLLCMERGLEAFRMIFSQYAHVHRGASEEFLKTGFHVYNDFLGKDKAEEIRKEFENFPLAVHKIHGQTVVSELQHQAPATYAGTFESPMMERVLTAIARINDSDAIQKYNSNTFIQRVHNKPSGRTEGTLMDKNFDDVQKQIHTDLFFPAVKFWYYPQDITLEMGPFCYAPGSGELTDNLAEWWYNESIKVVSGDYPKWKDPGHIEGSLRMSPQELIDFGFDNLTPCDFPADTLLVGNVFGWHHRGFATVESIRPAIHGSIRVNNPFEVV